MRREKPIDQYACAPTDDAEFSDVCGIGQDVKIQSKGNRTDERMNERTKEEKNSKCRKHEIRSFGRVKGFGRCHDDRATTELFSVV